MSDILLTLTAFTSGDTDGARGWDFKACWWGICMLARRSVDGIGQIHKAKNTLGEEVEGARRNVGWWRVVSHAKYLSAEGWGLLRGKWDFTIKPYRWR